MKRQGLGRVKLRKETTRAVKEWLSLGKRPTYEVIKEWLSLGKRWVK